jgi:hypothetical protein
MNLHAIAGPLVAAVNPSTPLQLQRSTGSTIGSDGKQTPTYAAPVTVMGQVQALTYDDIHQLDYLNIQGIRRAIYLEGNWEGLDRSRNKGGDLITFPDGSIWLVAHVLERWPHFVKVAVTLQDNA